MSDAVSRQAVSDLVKNRLNKVLAGVGSAEEIKDPFDRGKATAYQNILYDISTKLSPIELEKEIESLKAITELAVTCLQRIDSIRETFPASFRPHNVEAAFIKAERLTTEALEEIERLQNG